MQVQSKEEERRPEYEENLLELKSGEKLRVLNGACMYERMMEGMPVVSGRVGGEVLEVLRDTGRSGVVVQNYLVNKSEMTGEIGYMMTVDKLLMRAPIARINVDTPYFSGTVEVGFERSIIRSYHRKRT